MTKTLERIVKFGLRSFVALSLLAAASACGPQLYGCVPNGYGSERCKRDVCVKKHEECETVDTSYDTTCNNENGCWGKYGKAEKGETYETSGGTEEVCHTVCDKYKTVNVTVDHVTR